MKQALIFSFRKAALPLVLVLSLSFSANLFAQNAIQLVNNETGVKLDPILTGRKVVYSLKPVSGQPAPKAISGILSEVTPTNATINGVTVNFADMSRFGARNPKTLLGSGLLSGVGLALIRIATAEPQKISGGCQGCQPISVEKEKSTGTKVALIGVGTGLTGLAIANLLKNPSKDLSKWDLEAVEAEYRK